MSANKNPKGKFIGLIKYNINLNSVVIVQPMEKHARKIKRAQKENEKNNKIV